MTSTSSSSMTRSRLRSSLPSKDWDCARGARADGSSRTAGFARVAACRSTPTVVVCPTATRACWGMFLLLEAVVQLRNEAGARQVVGAETALVHGLGGVHMSGATAILSRRSTLT